MRVLNIILMLLMILFIVVQYNDPDGLLWMVLYAVPATWTAIATFKRSLLAKRIVNRLLLLCLIMASAGVFWFWPDTAGWWRQAVWWETETAREGMGMMIILLVLVVVWCSRLLIKPELPGN